MKSIAPLCLLILCLFGSTTGYWVSLDRSSGKLTYRKSSNGDQVMDFSAVGYKGRDAPLPTPPVKVTLEPSGGDDTHRLQQAIDKVSNMKLDSNGFRGTIKLAPGTFNLGSGTIYITSSGVVISGSGTDSATGTVLNAHSLPTNILFKVNGTSDADGAGTGEAATITKTVPSGTSIVSVDNVSLFKPGDHVIVTWPWSPAWIGMMNMTQYWGRSAGLEKVAERVVVKVLESSNSIVLDIPIPFRIDLKYLDSRYSAQVRKISYPVPGRISNVGLQNFRAVKEVVEPNDSGCFLKMINIEDAWLSNLVLLEFGGTLGDHPPELWHSTLFIGGARITIDSLFISRSKPAPKPGDKPFDIALQGTIAQQILIKHTTAVGDNEYSFMSNKGVAGPNVFYNCTGLGKNVAQPHAYFATGLLYDNLHLPTGGIEFINRGAAGSGHGLAVAYSVAWRTSSNWLRVLSPPDSTNWALGCNATLVNVGLYTGVGTAGIIDSSDPEIPSFMLVSTRSVALLSIV